MPEEITMPATVTKLPTPMHHYATRLEETQAELDIWQGRALKAEHELAQAKEDIAYWTDRAIAAELQRDREADRGEDLRLENVFLHGEAEYLKGAGVLTLLTGFVCGGIAVACWVVAFRGLWPWGA